MMKSWYSARMKSGSGRWAEEVECAWEPTLEGAYVYIDGDTVTIRPTEKMRLHDEMEYQFRPIRPRQRQKIVEAAIQFTDALACPA